MSPNADAWRAMKAHGQDAPKPVRRGMRIAVLAVLAVAAPAAAQQPLNLDLERASPADSARPWGWTYGYSAFARPAEAFSLDSTVRHEGRRSLRIVMPDSAPPEQSIMMQIP